MTQQNPFRNGRTLGYRPEKRLTEPGATAVAQEIAGTPGLSRAERLRRWEQRTGLSRPTYYRRLDAGRGNAQG